MKTLFRSSQRQIGLKQSSAVSALMISLLILVSFNLFASGAVQAQQCGERVQAELERTNQILEDVQEKIRSISNTVTASQLDRAKSLLKISATVQEEAIKNCRAGHPMLAMRLTKEARDKAHAALGSVNTRDEDESVVLRQLEKTDELLARVRENVDGPVPPEFRARLERAHEMQRRAWELYRSGNPMMALKLTREVERTVRELMQRSRLDGRRGKSLERQFAQISSRLTELRTVIGECDNAQSAELMGKAEDALKEAKELFANNHLKQAKTALRLAGELGRKAHALCGLDDRASKRLDNLKNRAAKLEELAAGNDQALKLVHTAQANLAEAESLIAEGMTRAATGQLKAAEMLLRQARRLLGE